jgi:Family of unknown function (DUF6868)
MDILTLTSFFMWCTIINVGIMIAWVIVLASAPNFMYRMQTRWFPMPRESFNVIVYSALAMYRIVFVVFVLVPYVALLIVQ